MATHRHVRPLLPLLVWVWARVWSLSLLRSVSSHQFVVDGNVLELDDSNFDSAISAFDFILVDFYAPWCGHCKRLSPELDTAARMIAGLNESIVIAKLDADKYTKLASKYEIDGFPTLKLFMHGVALDYTVPRKADFIVRFLRKIVAPDVSLLESDLAIHRFVETAGMHFPIFIGFGLDKSLLAETASKYKKKAWFSVSKDFSEEIMVEYDFDKVPALVSLHPKYNERGVFYGPFEGEFLEDFIRQSQLPLSVPINLESLKLLNNDDRKVVVMFVEDELDERSLKLVKIVRAAATANRDLVFAYVGVKQWGEFVDTFDVNKRSKLPTMLVWDKNEEYHLVVGSESLNDEEDQGSQITRFLEGYREGRIITKQIIGPSFIGFIMSLFGIRTLYLIVFVVALIILIQGFSRKGEDTPQTKENRSEVDNTNRSVSESENRSEGYQSGFKDD